MVIGTDNFGCSDTTFIYVDVLIKPSLTLTNNPSICEGESTPLVANGADNYIWFPSSGLNSIIGSTVTANPSISTSYSVIGTLNNGCSDTISTVVSVNSNPNLSTNTLSTDLCVGDTTMLIVNGATNYVWTPSNSLSNNNSDTTYAFPINSTSYSVVGIDDLGCVSNVDINVNVNNLPNIVASSLNPEICIGDNTLLSATGGVQYSWFPNSTLSSSNGSTVLASPSVNTTYMLLGTDNNLCSSWDTISVLVNPLPVLNVNNNIEINKSGMRSNFDWNTPDRSLKILFFGDSVTYGGSAVSNDHLFSEITCNNLNLIKTDIKALCGNLAVNGYGIEQIYRKIKFKDISDENFIVITVIENDLERGFNSLGSQPFWTKEIKNFYPAITETLYIFLEKIRNYRFILSGNSEEVNDLEYYEFILEQLKVTLMNFQNNYLIIYSPSIHEIDNNKDNLLKKYLKKNFNNFIDLTNKNYLLNKNMYKDDIHLNKLGHKVYGEIISKEILKILEIND